MKKRHLQKNTDHIPDGFTLVEAIISLLVLAIMIAGLFACLTFIAGSAQRATYETQGNMRVIKTLELLEQYPYNMVTTNYFPIEYVTDNGELVYAITTTIVEVSSPTIHKNITIDHTWKDGGIQRHTRYYSIKPE